jgi:non-canonical purine NTP pyrophosphatase (RdgB/HAM1 family)
MHKTIVLASNNAGKVREFGALLAGLDMDVVPQSQFNVPEIEETGLTFVENAILKARNAANHARRPAIADDSGLEVDALDGAPGIYSARYAGPAPATPPTWKNCCPCWRKCRKKNAAPVFNACWCTCGTRSIRRRLSVRAPGKAASSP